jgi:hypothetical protein
MAEAALYARLENVLYRIEARYLGAMLAKDPSAAKLQRDTYKDATQLMGVTATSLSTAVDVAQSWLRNQPKLEAQARGTLARWSRKGLKRDNSAARQALDAKTAKLVEKLVQSPELVAAAMDGIEANLGRLRSAVMQTAAYAARDRLRFERRGRKG